MSSEDLGKRLRELRDRRKKKVYLPMADIHKNGFSQTLREVKITQKDVSNETGISVERLSALENGIFRRPPTPKEIRNLSRYYDESQAHLLQIYGYFRNGAIVDDWKTIDKDLGKKGGTNEWD